MTRHVMTTETVKSRHARAATFLAAIPNIGETTIERVAGLGLLRWIGRADGLTGLAVIPHAATIGPVRADGTTSVQADLVLRIRNGRGEIRRGVRVAVQGYANDGLKGIFDIDVHAPALTPLDAVAFPQDAPGATPIDA